MKMFKQSVDSMKNHVESWRREQGRNQTLTDSLKEQLWSTENRLTEAKMKLHILEDKNEGYESEIAALKHGLEKANAENFRLCAESCKLESDLSEERDKRQTFEAENKALKTQLVKLGNDISNLSSEKAELVKYYGLAEANAKEKADELLRLSKDKEEEEKSLQEKIDNLTSDYKQMSSSNDVLQMQIKQERSNKEDAFGKFEHLKRQFKEVEEQKKKFKTKSEELMTKLNQANEKMKLLANLENSFKKQKAECSTLQTQLVEKAKEVEVLRDHYDKEVCVRRSAEEILLSLEKQLAECDQEKDFSIRELTVTKEKLFETRKKATDLESIIAVQKEHYDFAQAQHAKRTAKMDDLFSKTREEVQRKAKENAELQKLLLEKELDVGECKRKLAECENLLKAIQQQDLLIQQRNKELEADVCDMRCQWQKQLQEKMDHSDQSDFEESVFVNQMVTRLRLSRKKYEEFKEKMPLYSSQNQVVLKIHCTGIQSYINTTAVALVDRSKGAKEYLCEKEQLGVSPLRVHHFCTYPGSLQLELINSMLPEYNRVHMYLHYVKAISVPKETNTQS
ncbi:cingulin-like isoform X2 [Rhopilema esculentum]